MRKRLILALALVAVGASVGAYFDLHHQGVPVRFETAAVTRGPIAKNVVCTGTLQAIATVQVGTQASGVIKELNVDYNSLVRKGQVIARLDSAAIEAQIAQGQADLEQAKSNVIGLGVTLDEANRQLARNQALFAQHLVDASDLEDVRVAAEQAAADVEAGEDAVKQTQAAIDQARVNLTHTVITSPIDGIVISRDVDVGQTVVSSMQANTLFEIANDLSRMQLQATVDESDIGMVREGDQVTFTVEAYPDRRYTGLVTQVRVNPTIDQNVVSYVTVIDVPNADLTLRPGLTANAAILGDSRDVVTLVPSAAVRFKPFDELFAALHQPVPSVVRNPLKAPLAGDQRRVWLLRHGALTPVTVRVGLSDEASTEIVGDALRPGDTVVTDAILTR